MQKNEIFELLEKIDAHLEKAWKEALGGNRIPLRIFGKSALLLAGLQDSTGTADIDLLRVESRTSANEPEIIAGLEREFGKSRLPQ